MTKKQPRDFEEIFLCNDVHKGKIKILWQMVSSQKLRMVLMTLFFIIMFLPDWVTPIIMQNTIDAVIAKNDRTIFIILINFAVAAILMLQNIPTSTIFNRYLSLIVRDTEVQLRESLARKLLQLSMTFHKDYKSGKIQSKMLRDAEAIKDLLHLMGMAYITIIIGIGSAVIILYKSRVVFLFFMVLIPLSLLLVRMFQPLMRNAAKELRAETETMSANISEMIEMIPVSKAHGLDGIELSRIVKQFRSLRKKALTADVTEACFSASLWVSLNLPKMICLAYTGILAYRGDITPGDVVLYFTLFSQILQRTFFGLLNMYPYIVKGMESITSVAEILTSPDVEDNRGKTEVKNLDGKYCFKNVGFAYPDALDTDVLHDFSLEVKKGECVAFVGESGAGKTTILNLIIGFNHPQKGMVCVDGVNLRDLNLVSYRTHISVVPQNTVLFSGSIRDNITYGLTSVTDEEVQNVIDLANLRTLIDRLPNGVDALIGEHGGKLSGGQRQRIAIARAMIRRPDVIILDEATSSLDTISETEVQKAMNRLIEDKTTFIVAHRFSTIRGADKIVFMKNGRAAEVGTYKQLMEKRGEFFNMEFVNK